MSELTHLENTLTLPGCTLHKCGLQIDGAIDAEQEKRVGTALNTIGGSTLWWWGDYLCHLGKRYGETYTEAAEESSYSPPTLRQAKWVCGKFQLSNRIDNLSFTHHMVALGECDGAVDSAQGWLAKAVENGWTVSELRMAIRKANAPEQPDPTEQGQSSPYDHVKELKLWLRTSLTTATPELRAELKRDLLEIVEKL